MKENDDFLDDFTGVKFSFKARPIPIPVDLRPDWRLAIILLILYKCCRSSRGSLRKLHVLNWAIRTSEARSIFQQLVDGRISPVDVIVRYEPGLSRAIDLALGEGLVEKVDGDRIQLTQKGKKCAADIGGLSDCFEQEKIFLNNVGKAITEKRLQGLIDMVVGV